ncbi:hypothetical protein DFR70_12058 [Nocardia tenerifensis]|uniref:Uncharacterized protein n=1 Tax=Nocardia tenerifensis TaxID=228006 RepID=A0A318KCN0_9NOCA|nr:hypothetical protein DFR70_12058 [Nocardia tenerifensis]
MSSRRTSGILYHHEEDSMSDTTNPSMTDRGQDQVVWPEPSPLDSWWNSVMYVDSTSG